MMRKLIIFLLLVLLSSYAYGVTIGKGTYFYTSFSNVTWVSIYDMTGIEWVNVLPSGLWIKGYYKDEFVIEAYDHNITPLGWAYFVDEKKVYINLTENVTVYLLNISSPVKSNVTGEYEVYRNGTLYETSVTSANYNITSTGLWYFKSDVVPATLGNISIDYDLFTHETELVSWSLTMDKNISYDYYDVKLVLENGTKYGTIKSYDGDYAIYTADFAIPPFLNYSSFTYLENYYFSAYYYLNGTTDTNVFFTNVTKLNVSPSINLTCTDTGLYIESHDEDTGLLVNITVELDIQYWWGSGGLGGDEEFIQYNYEFPYDKKLKLCEWENYTYNVYVKYTDLLNQTQRWYMRRYSNELISMYSASNRDDYSLLKVTVRDKRDYSLMENVYVSLERWYVGEGIWRTVQIDRSDDYGATAFYVHEETTDYRLVFRDENNSIYDRTSQMKFYCTAGDCEITYLIDPTIFQEDYPDVEVSVSYNNDTSFLTVLWEVPTGYNINLYTDVIKETFTGSLDICNEASYGSAGVQTCDLTGHTGTVFVGVHSDYDDLNNYHYSEYLELSSSKLHTVIPRFEGALWTFGIMVTIIGFGLFSPVGAVLATVFGLIVIMFLGIFKPITITFVIIATVIGIAIGVKLKR